LRTDVKQLLITQSGNVVKIANLEQDIEELKTNYLSHELATLRKESEPNKVGKKEEGPEVPTGESASNTYMEKFNNNFTWSCNYFRIFVLIYCDE